MAKEQIGSNAQFLGPQAGYSVVKDRVYAYSGKQVIDAGAFTTQLSFNTGKEVLDVDFQWTNTETNSTRDVYIDIEFNGQLVFSGRWENPNIVEKGANPVRMIIPPYTFVECKQKNDGTTSGCFLMSGVVV